MGCADPRCDRVYVHLMKMKKVIVIFLLSMAVGGCSGQLNIPVINKSPDRVIPDAYAARAGDSIYNIAWAFGVDHLDLIKWNRLKPPYRVSPGQVVLLREPTAKTIPLDPEIEQSKIATALPQKQPVKPEPVKTASPVAPEVGFSSTPGKWNWPAKGKLTGKFAPSKGRNGIQISGSEGSGVKASADGEVVYVGEGIRGYGKLVIVKHSKQFLSAYAHNKEIVVNEGQRVKSGEQIALMGSSGAPSTMLHFEIRKDSVPVDPLKYLN